MFGFIEVITLLLGISGFSVQPNPKAPSPDVSLQYAMPDADVVVHFDAASVVPNNYKVLQALPNNAGIKASPELAKMVRKAIGEVEGARGLAKSATGIDLATDVNDATMFFQIVPQKDPTFVAVVHGTFTPANLDKIAKTSNRQVTKVGAGSLIEMGKTDPAIGLTKDGVLLAGTPDLVKARIADGWKAPARATGSNLAYAAEVLGQKPVFAVVLTMSPAARKEATAKHGGKNFLTDIIARHKLAAFSVFTDGIGWTWIDSSKTGLDNMELMSQGAIELMRAGHIAPRGMAKLALGALESYRGTDKQIDEVLKRKAEVMKIVETYTGDGTFKATVNKDPKTLRLTVRAQGKSLSEVVPAGFALPVAAFSLFAVRSGGASMSSSPTAPAIATPPPPVTNPHPAPQPKQGLGGKKP